jgi:hypothetical protein
LDRTFDAALAAATPVWRLFVSIELTPSPTCLRA